MLSEAMKTDNWTDDVSFLATSFVEMGGGAAWALEGQRACSCAAAVTLARMGLYPSPLPCV